MMFDTPFFQNVMAFCAKEFSLHIRAHNTSNKTLIFFMADYFFILMDETEVLTTKTPSPFNGNFREPSCPTVALAMTAPFKSYT